MAHFAEIVDGLVVRVVVADTQDWCEQNLGGEWVQTSYNTYGGVHLLGGEPLRKNYAGVGYKYDAIRDAFVPPKPTVEGKSFVLDENSCLWIEETI